jgi:hypothetical protein
MLQASAERKQERSLKRVLVLTLVLLSVSVLASGQVLAQQKQQGSSGSGSGSTTQTRHPGDYCTSHCRANEIPCGRGCLSSTSTKKCTEKVTTTCAGKP